MKLYPIQWEVYEDSMESTVATFKAFDTSIEVSIDNYIMDPEGLIKLSECLKKAYLQYTEPDKEK